MEADTVWVETKVLKANHGGMKEKEGDDVCTGHDFGECASDGKV